MGFQESKSLHCSIRTDGIEMNFFEYSWTKFSCDRVLLLIRFCATACDLRGLCLAEKAVSVRPALPFWPTLNVSLFQDTHPDELFSLCV